MILFFSKVVFQFLIGSLEAGRLCIELFLLLFQFLIGSLEALTMLIEENEK